MKINKNNFHKPDLLKALQWLQIEPRYQEEWHTAERLFEQLQSIEIGSLFTIVQSDQVKLFWWISVLKM